VTGGKRRGRTKSVKSRRGGGQRSEEGEGSETQDATEKTKRWGGGGPRETFGGVKKPL